MITILKILLFIVLYIIGLWVNQKAFTDKYK